VSPFDTTAARIAGVRPGGGTGAAVAGRGEIFAMIQAAEDAVLRPRETGAFPHDLRAALAARIARLSGDGALAERHLSGAGGRAAVADPSMREDGPSLPLGFVDKVANGTREIAAEDIAALRSGGMSDADIVRLCELIAFMAFQIRVVAGLRLMEARA
jgi:uncharacterized protein YciW